MAAILVVIPVVVVIPSSLKIIQIPAVIPAVVAEPIPVAEPMKSKALAVALAVLGMVTVPAKAQVKG